MCLLCTKHAAVFCLYSTKNGEYLEKNTFLWYDKNIKKSAVKSRGKKERVEIIALLSNGESTSKKVRAYLPPRDEYAVLGTRIILINLIYVKDRIA